MGMCVLIELCSLVEFRWTWYEMGERKEELVITVIIRVLPVPCPLPLSPVTFTSEPKCHISMPETQSHSGITLTALIPALPIDLLFRQSSSLHHGLCISSLFMDLKQYSDSKYHTVENVCDANTQKLCYTICNLWNYTFSLSFVSFRCKDCRSRWWIDMKVAG